MSMDPQDTGRRGAALVTGAGRRIGAAIARALARDGRAVALHCLRSSDDAEALAAEITEAGGAAAVVTADLANAREATGLVARAAAAVGPLELLVNNASLFEDDAIGALDALLWDRQMAVNLRAPVLLAEAFAAQLPEGARGCVVNMLDQRVLKLTPRSVSYTLSKTALATATMTLAQALAPMIRVVGVAPGPTLANTRQSGDDFDRQARAVPLGRGPTPEEIADAVVFLSHAGSVTGTIVPVDGGQHLAWSTPDVAGVE